MSTPTREQVFRRGLGRAVRAASLGVILAGALGVASSGVAHAQATGDVVILETDTGRVEGTLLDKLPDGYLVRVEGRSLVVPYARVKSIARAPAPTPAPPIVPSAPQPIAPSAPPPIAPSAPLPIAAPSVPLPIVPPPVVITPPVDAPLVAPAPSPIAPPPPKPRASALTTGGAVATVFGSIGLFAGVLVLPVGLLLRSTQTCHDKENTITFDCAYGNGGALVAGGAATLVTGGVLLAGGVTMLAAGGGSARPKRGSVLAPAAFTVAPQGATVVWTF